MGDPNQFRPSLSSEPNPFSTDSHNAPLIQEGPSALRDSQSVHPSSVLKPVFGQSTESSVSKSSIFGGSSFMKPSENSFAGPGRTIFGGTAHLGNTSQLFNPPKSEGSSVSESNFFGSSQTVFGNAPPKIDERMISAPNSIFGGTFSSSQTPNVKEIPFAGVASQSREATSTTKPRMFGGTSSPKEEPFQKSGFSAFSQLRDTELDGNSEKPRNAMLGSIPGEPSKGPFDRQSLGRSSEKHLFFSSSKASFGRFPSASSTVTSTVSKHAQEKSDLFAPSDNLEKKEELLLLEKHYLDQSWEPDSMGNENQDETFQQPQEGKRSTRIVRKPSVLGKAIQDTIKLPKRSSVGEELRSVFIHPTDRGVITGDSLKNHFEQFGKPRITLCKGGYGIATFKTHEEASRAMKGTRTIDGVKCKFLWRNLSAVRRKSTEERESLKSPQEEKKQIRRSAAEMDPAVREELEAISGMDYLVPLEASSKRKAALDSEIRKKSRPRMKTNSVDLEAQARRDVKEPGRRINTLRTEGIKDLTSRSVKSSKETRGDEKLPSLLSRRNAPEKPSAKKSVRNVNKAESDEYKVQKAEHTVADNSTIPSTASTELLQILKLPAFSSDDKLRVLEARDKLMRLRQVKQYDIAKAVKTVGTCPDMCPEKERLLRESRRQISQYEMNSLKANEMDPSLMVKQYSRSSADQEEPLPHELRPPPVLTMTMNYLMHTVINLGDRPGENLAEWYHFLWDRLRGIRKEITQQELCDLDAVRLVEQCARFHIHCGARLVAEDMSVFDDRINTENLTKCLQTLKHMYHDLWMNNSITCPNEPEFVTYFLLLNLNNGTIMWEMEQLREEVLESPDIGFVAAMYNSLSSNNFVRFFRLVRKASYLNSCLCIRYFYQVRAKAISTLVKALAKSRPVQYPLAALVNDLAFENADRAAAFCSHNGLMVVNSSAESTYVVLSPDYFCNSGFTIPAERAFGLAESKKIGSVGEVVNGGPLPPRSFENHTVHDSFDGNGCLRKIAFYAKDQGMAGMDLKDDDADVCSEVIQKDDSQVTQEEAIANEGSATVVADDNMIKIPPEYSASFRALGNQNLMVPSVLSVGHPANPSPFNAPPSQVFKSAFSLPTIVPPQPLSNKQETVAPSISQAPGQSENLKGLLYRNVFADQSQVDIEAKLKAKAKLDSEINEIAETELQVLLQSGAREAAVEVAQVEMIAAEEEQRAQEKLRAEEQLRTQEALRRRALDAHVDRISNDSMKELVDEVVGRLIVDSVQEMYCAEKQLVEDISKLSEESLKSLMQLVTEEVCTNVTSEEFKKALESARKEAVQCRVREIFFHWLQRARRSLHRRRIMDDFPASVIPLSLKEHAERWGFSANLQEVFAKHNEKTPDLPELKATSAYPQMTFADLIGVQAVHRYDSIRTKVGLGPTDKLLYKLFISVPEECKEPAAELIDWWIRRTFKQNCGTLHDDVEKGVYRVLSGVKVTSDVAVYTSLQMVKGHYTLEKQQSLASGTCAILFTLSPASSILTSCSRLTTLLKSVQKLPAMPLVVTVISSSEPPLDGLKQLVIELDLDKWLSQGVISDYQILYVEELFDLKYLSERFNMALNYMVMMWTPSPEFSLVRLKNVLKSTFQMFYISIQFNYNSSEVYPQDIDDPRVIVGLCNEWLDHMCHEFVSSYQEATYLCGEEFWPLLHKGAYLPFINNPCYVELLQKEIQSVYLPQMKWPPSSEDEFETQLTQYCSWLRPEDLKQSQRRLSCLNGLTWHEKVKSMPWVNLIEDWMEARINYMDENKLLCLMRAQNVEHLYTYPWWAQSAYIISYLESHSSGREYDMDVDQTVPSESLLNEHVNTETLLVETAQKQTTSGVNHLQEVVDCVSALKNVNKSLMERLRSSLSDTLGNTSESPKLMNIESKRSFTKDSSASSKDLKTLVNTIDLQVQAQRNLRNNISQMFTKALAEGNECVAQKTESLSSSVEKGTLQLTAQESCGSKQSSKEGILEENSKISMNRMDEITATASKIVSSLNQKYNILESKSNFGKITELKLGLGKADSYPALLSSEELEPSPYVAQSQHRMQGRLQRSTIKESSESCERTSPANSDSDLDILSDERSESPILKTISSPSSLEHESIRSDSDVVYDDELNDGMRHHHHSDIDDEDDDDHILEDGDVEDGRDVENSERKGRRFSKDSEENYSSRRKRFHRDGSDKDESCGEGDESEYDSSDEDEIQTISSEDSRDSACHHVNYSVNPFSTDNLVNRENQQSLNQAVFGSDILSQNGDLATENDSEGNLLNLDNVSNHYQYYSEGGVDMHGHVYSESELGVLHSDNPTEVLVSNPEHGSEGNDHLPLHQGEQNDKNVMENVYEVGEDGDYNHSDETHHALSDEDDDKGDEYNNTHSSQLNLKSEQSPDMKYEDSGSEVEAYEDVDEEECGDEVREEDEEEAASCEEEEELDSEAESVTDEDSDVCEVIDDD